MVKQFVKNVKEGVGVEGELIKTILYSLVSSFLVLGFVWFLRLKNEGNFSNYNLFLFFAIVSYSVILLSVKHVRAYKNFQCMSGMMIGMTTGMIAGFLPGFFVASTNGMFVGSVFGMFVGISLGIWNGNCCGVMGFMEGTMSGFMGGLMGAMTAFMLYNDHLIASMIIVFAVSMTILIGLHYMIYVETKDRQVEINTGYFGTIILSIVLTSITIWLMALGPRSGVFG